MTGTKQVHDIRQRLRVVFASVLAAPENQIDGLTTDNCERWDSLHHIKLILAMEREFGTEIDTDAVDLMYSSFVNCLDFLSGRLAEPGG